MHAPRRDADTRAGSRTARAAMDAVASDTAAQPKVICDALKFLLDGTSVMRIDATNPRLRLIAPVVMVHGIDFSRGMSNKLSNLQVNLGSPCSTLNSETVSYTFAATPRVLKHQDRVQGVQHELVRKAMGDSFQEK
jgi:hypothetical protein